MADAPSGIPKPPYDRSRIGVGVVHFGVGGFHRAHQAMYHDRLLAAGAAFEWGICGVGVMPGDRPMLEALDAQDGIYTLVVKPPDGRYEARRIGSIVDARYAPDDRDGTAERLADPDVRIVSLTVTEGGYTPLEGEPLAFELIAEGLRRRRDRGIAPFTVMSCDNLEANGGAARAALLSVAGDDLGGWIEREVAFPSSMVDRITPATTDADREEVRRRFGIDDRLPVVCEPFAQWVLEDRFPAGRPPYEHAGVQLVDDVRPYELMKMRLLNGSHQALAYFGLLLGHSYVDEAARDPLIAGFVARYMDEVAPTLPAVPGVDLDDYRRTLVERFANAHVRDTLARVAAMPEDRLPKFVLPAIRDRLAAGAAIDCGAAVVASWAHQTRAGDEPGALLARPMFGDLGADERFATAYRRTLGSLTKNGVAATLTELPAG